MAAPTPTCDCGVCKKCKHRVHMRAWYAKNPERARELKRLSYHRNQEKYRKSAREWRNENIDYARDQERLRGVKKAGGLTIRSCDWCGYEMEVTARRAAEEKVFCSARCKDKYRNAETARKLLESKEERSCLECGAVIGREMRRDAVYCSAACNSAAHHHTSKASFRIGESQRRVSRIQVYERDGFRCWLCLNVFEASDLTLDHVIPLAKGGTHDLDNLRAACLRCNCSKGAKIIKLDW